MNIPDSEDLRKIKIRSIELTPLFVPFREIVRQAMSASDTGLGMMIPAEEEWLGGEFVICRLQAEDGRVGLGEVFVWLPETGVSPAQIIDAVRYALSMYVLGQSPFDIERINERMDNNVARSEVAKGMLDMACWDLMGRIAGQPACELMGGPEVDEVPLAALIPIMDLDSMVAMAKGFCSDGMRTVRVKLGKSIEDDVKIMGKMRSELGDDIRMRVDYNQAYTPDDAVRAIKAIEAFGIDLAEQPVRATDPLGMAYVQKRVDTPLMSHEGCFSLQDIQMLTEIGAIGVVGINSERPGGVTNALRAIEFAEKRGMGAVLHNQPLGISSAMHVHLAAARHSLLGHATELFGHVMLEDDLIRDPVDYSGGTAKVPAGPGWGVELDEDALERYATGEILKMEA